MKTVFRGPGVRCIVRRSTRRTAAFVQAADSTARSCNFIIQCAVVGPDGLSQAAPVELYRRRLDLTVVPGEKRAEGRVILPGISDTVWPRCYVLLRHNSPDECPASSRRT